MFYFVGNPSEVVEKDFLESDPLLL